MKIYLVRHGQTQYNVERRATGVVDVPLTQAGILQVQDATRECPKDIVKIFSSDLMRCKQTAQIFAEYLSVSIEYDARLRERNFGTLEGKKIDEFETGLWQKDINQEYDYRPYGGESVLDVRTRLESVLSDIRNEYPDGHVLIVAHGGIVRLLQKIYLGKPEDKVHNSLIYEFDI